MWFSIVRGPIRSILVFFGGRDLNYVQQFQTWVFWVIFSKQPYFCCRYYLIVWNNLANVYLWRQCFAALGPPTRPKNQFLWQTSNRDFMFLSSNREGRLFCQTFAFDRNACNRSIPIGGPWRGEDECPQVRLLGAKRKHVNRGYYTVVRRYEFYVRVARTMSHEWAQRPSEIFLPREHKIHIFEPICNVLIIIWRNQFNKSKRRESWRHWMIRHSQRWHTENTHSGSGWSGVWNLRVV